MLEIKFKLLVVGLLNIHLENGMFYTLMARPELSKLSLLPSMVRTRLGRNHSSFRVRTQGYHTAVEGKETQMGNHVGTFSRVNLSWQHLSLDRNILQNRSRK